MERVLTGIQSTGVPHLGNILGAILPAIELGNQKTRESFFFIADFHALTQIKNKDKSKENTYNTAISWLACGLDVEKSIFYRQSDIPQVTELMWYLNCFSSYQRLTLSHSFKDKKDTLKEINTGLFTYPILMAADILLYDANSIPVGKDQLQHIEITRDIAVRFNNEMGEVFIIPKAKLSEENKYILGVDGNKMSKSKNNTVDVFLPEKQLRKQIMQIQTDSLSVGGSKNPENCTVFSLYKAISKPVDVVLMREKYIAGGYGYGSAKQELFDAILEKFKTSRVKFNYYKNNLEEVERLLQKGAKEASERANQTLERVRACLGFK